MKLKYIKMCMKNPSMAFVLLGHKGWFKWLDDEKYLKKIFKIKLGYELNLDNPQTLNEKLQWLKLHDRRPEYTIMVDKYAVKKYVADKIGKEYIIPTLGVWDRFDDIDFDTLPNQFVLKCTHDSGGSVICKDKLKFNMRAAKKKINRRLKSNYFWVSREWPYKNVYPRIIAEPLMKTTDEKPLADYKIYTYGGKPIYFMYSIGEMEHKVKNHKFDINGNSIDYLFKKNKVIDEKNILLPDNLAQMISIAEKLCEGIQHLRVDLYNIDGKIYFGELTFFSGGGIINIRNENYSKYLAGLVDITALEKKGEFCD